MNGQVFATYLGPVPREDFLAYVADFFLQLEDVNWTIVSGLVNGSLIICVRNLGYSRNAGEFVKKSFAEIGSAGGHRAMAKAVIPIQQFREKFGNLEGADLSRKVAQLFAEFLHEHPASDRRKEPIRAE